MELDRCLESRGPAPQVLVLDLDSLHPEEQVDSIPEILKTIVLLTLAASSSGQTFSTSLSIYIVR